MINYNLTQIETQNNQIYKNWSDVTIYFKELYLSYHYTKNDGSILTLITNNTFNFNLHKDNFLIYHYEKF